MYRARKIRLHPTPEQEILLQAHVRAYREAYNWGLARQVKEYESTRKRLGVCKLLREFRATGRGECKCQEGVASHSTARAFYDLEEAFQRFHRVQKQGVKFSPSAARRAARQGRKLTLYDLKGHPKFKSWRTAKKSFCTSCENTYFKNGCVNLEKIGKVPYKTNYKMPQGRGTQKFSNPRVAFIRGKWILTLGMEVEEPEITLFDYSVGVDLGIKEFAVVSYDGGKILTFHNVNKEPRVRKLKARLRRAQRRFSKTKFDKKTGYASANRRRTGELVAELHGRLAAIRLDYVHKVTRKIVNLCPQRIVLEDLNVQGMMKNHHLANSIQEQLFYEARRQLTYKSEGQGTEVRIADRWYPSSKTCSRCGHLKKNLKLSDRIYYCEKCGHEEDRDANAAHNLENYE